MDISVIIPVFRGENSLGTLFERIHENLVSKGSFEVLFIYDRGPDNSWEILKKLKSKYPEEIRIFKLKKNYGQHNAILYGISEAKGELLITMDEDLQHDPCYLGPLLEKQRECNYTVVYGRFQDPKHPLFRKIASGILQKFLKYFIPGLGYYSSYRIIKRETAQKIVNLKNSYTFIDANLIKVTSEIGYLDIDHRGNTVRKTTYNIARLISHALRIILAYTRITKWMFISSAILIVFAAILSGSGFADKKIQVGILMTGLIMLILGIGSDLYHRWEEKKNTLPVISVENE